MKTSIEHISEESETEVVIYCHAIDDEVSALLTYLDSPPTALFGEVDKELHLLDPEKIYYVESFDRRVFIYGECDKYISRKKLYELEEELPKHQFFRASKWMILNTGKIESVRPVIDGRMEAMLKNKKKVYISRKYVGDLKSILGINRRK
ncbi:LytTR family DNA-binding domain-containing protein [Spirochaeta isovalerica]|uniref:DNA-binding LytR/AlgR family response regulator n=1 Tax=Spirochaeta isovalerica TaxID=150 RepID=A0A841RBI4_9SPIO|nr:LytTR family DNA-binding domain-containing protein [Spirochaeta isovalerica]MBB6480269.1 DNA-binding LytR/AlgR family response regulator [Spirochaeta isovalerica]